MAGRKVTATLRLHDPDDPTFGWTKQATVTVAEETARAMLAFDDHEPFQLRGYQDEEGCWELWLLDLSP